MTPIDISQTPKTHFGTIRVRSASFAALCIKQHIAKVDLPPQVAFPGSTPTGSGKDHTKVYEAVAIVEKAMSRGGPSLGFSQRGSAMGPHRSLGTRTNGSVRCFFCGKLHHFMSTWYARRSTQRPPAARGRGGDDK